MHARMASGLLLALGFADLAVLNLLLAPRLKEQGVQVVAERVAEARSLPPPEPAPSPPGAPTPCPPATPAGAAPAASAEAAPDILFELGEVQISGGRAADVEKVADALRADKGRRLVVRGHADRLGTAERNLKLSRQRAENVLRLLKAFGAPFEQMSVEALGDAEPASPSDTPLGWARDRRVQLLWR